ncbi:MAG: DUF4383 domain-containing protein [Phycisphaerales bacterium]|nr:DUF4383 domain-containing protein [Phycisphaerales bacterium]
MSAMSPSTVQRWFIPNAVCVVMGTLFLVIALWGFVDGERVLIFHVNAAHNMVHLISGLAALACGLFSLKAAIRFCLIFGVVYFLVALLGFLNVPLMNEALHLNDADDFLHLLVAIIFLAAPTVSAAIRD